MLPLVGTAINSGVSLLGNVLQNKMNEDATQKANQQTEDFQMAMYARQRQDALADRAFANDYNSPAAQMARLKAAGLNPNLAYGQGAAAQASSPVRSADGGGYTARVANKSLDLSGVLQGMMMALSMDQTKQQTDNLRAAKDLTVQETITKILEQSGIMSRTQGQDIQNERDKALIPPTVEGAYQNVARTMTEMQVLSDRNEREAAMQAVNIDSAVVRIAQMRAQTANTEAERKNIEQNLQNLRNSGVLQQLDINLKKLGIQPHDPAWMRVIAQALDKVSSVPSGRGTINVSPEEADSYGWPQQK